MAILCECCNREFYESVIRECPKKLGHYICLYCCRKCKRSYRDSMGGIYGCKAFDAQKDAEKDAGTGMDVRKET